MDYFNNEKEIKKINSFLNEHLWVDFCFEKVEDNYLKLVGSKDFSWGETIIEIEFIGCIYANILLNTWTKPDNHVFIEIQNNNKESYVECKLSHDVCKFVIYAQNDFNSIIYAKDLRCRLFNE